MTRADDAGAAGGGDGDEWQDLMPDRDRAWVRTLETWFDIAMYRRPENIGFFEAWMAAMGLSLLPIVVLTPLLALTGLYALATGQVALADLVALHQTAASTSPQTLDEIVSEMALSLLQFAIEFPLFLGSLALLKALLGIKHRGFR